MIIAVDFDGTISLAGYPQCGIPNTRLIDELNDYQRNGAKIVLWTCRHDELLNEAVDFCRRVGLKVDYVNENVPCMIEKFGDSRKIYADYYIDDKNKPLPEVKPKHGAYEQAKVEVFGWQR